MANDAKGPPSAAQDPFVRLAGFTKKLLAVPPAEAAAVDRKWQKRKNKGRKAGTMIPQSS